MVEITHADIFNRLETAEKDLLIVNTQVDRIREDVREMKSTVQTNGEIAKEINVTLKTIKATILFMIPVLAILITLFNFFSISIVK